VSALDHRPRRQPHLAMGVLELSATAGCCELSRLRGLAWHAGASGQGLEVLGARGWRIGGAGGAWEGGSGGDWRRWGLWAVCESRSI
jgi:hypothetical protein